MGCEAQNAAIAVAIASICNAADRPSRQGAHGAVIRAEDPQPFEYFYVAKIVIQRTFSRRGARLSGYANGAKVGPCKVICTLSRV